MERFVCAFRERSTVWGRRFTGREVDPVEVRLVRVSHWASG